MSERNLRHRLDAAKARVRIPDAWLALGLDHPPRHGQTSARSPFRPDKTPSLSIFDNGRAWKDHAHSGHSGDVVTFVQAATGCDRATAIETILAWAGDTAPLSPNRPRLRALPVARAPLNVPTKRTEAAPKPPPSLADATPLRPDECRRIADSRGLPVEACTTLAARGHLVAAHDGDGEMFGWVLADGPMWPAPTADGPRFPAVGYVVEARRLDRKKFTCIDAKAKTLPGSRKDWPIGISALAWPGRGWRIALVCEGGPDLLAAHALLHHLGRSDVLPVALLSRETRRLHPEAAELLKGRWIHCIPHADPPHDGRDFRNGRASAEAWARDLFWPAGVARVTCTTLEVLARPDGQPAKDLCDAIEHGGLERNAEKLQHLIPTE